MQYMLMIYYDEKRWAQMPEVQREKIMQESDEFRQGIVDERPLPRQRSATAERDGHHRAREELQAGHHR